MHKPIFWILLSFASGLASGQSDKEIHNKAIVIDSHNDILSSGLDSAFSIDQNLTGKTDIDLRRARQGGLDVQVFTICSDTERVHPFHYACQLLDTLHAWAARNPHT